MMDTFLDDAMDLRHLRRPTGNRKSWSFRMVTPSILVGRVQPDNPGKRFGTEIVRGLGTRYLREATAKRDELEALILGWVRQAENRPAPWLDDLAGTRAAADLKAVRDTEGEDSEAYRLTLETAHDEAERVEQHRGPATSPAKQRERAGGYLDAALGRKRLSEAHKDYAKSRAEGTGSWSMRPNTLIELRKTVDRLKDHMGGDVFLGDVTPRHARLFISEYLDNATGPKGKLSRKTIASARSYLAGLWRWAIAKEYLPEGGNLWKATEIPAHVGRDTARARRDPFEREDWHRLAAEVPLCDPLGDLMRIALFTGARRGEIAVLHASDVTQEPFGFWLTEDNRESLKTVNAARWVPLVGMAAEIVKRRVEAEHRDGLLFGDVDAAKIGDALGKRFKTVTNRVLDTKGRALTFHSFRHTFQTRARRAGVAPADSADITGWTEGTNKGSGRRYDHGHDSARYVEIVRQITARYAAEGYVTEEEAGGGAERDA